MEPTLFLLANLGVQPPAVCGQAMEPEDEDPEVGDECTTIGQIRQALLRWYRTLPAHRRPRAVQIALALVGEPTSHETRVSQQVARNLQATGAGVEDEVVNAILQNWGDTSDVPIVEAFLRHQAGSRHHHNLMQAADALRAGRQKRKPQQTPQGRQRLLVDMWNQTQAGTASSTNANKAVYIPENVLADTVENPGTYLPRLQILRLEQTWPALSETTRERVLATVISQLPEADLRGQATVIAAIYAQIDQDEAPKQLVDLRIGLRARQPDAINETKQIETQHIDSSTEEEERRRGEEEQRRGDERAPESPPQRDKKLRRPSKKAPRLTQREIAMLGRLPRKPREERKSTKEESSQTVGRRRCVWHGNFHRARPVRDIWDEPAEPEPPDMGSATRNFATQTGGRRRSEVHPQDIQQLPPEMEMVANWLAGPHHGQVPGGSGAETTTRARSPSLNLTDTDRGQLEGAEQATWAQEYEQMLQDEAAEAQHMAEAQDEIDSEEAREAQERAQLEAMGGNTYMDDSDSGRSMGSSS